MMISKNVKDLVRRIGVWECRGIIEEIMLGCSSKLVEGYSKRKDRKYYLNKETEKSSWRI